MKKKDQVLLSVILISSFPPAVGLITNKHGAINALGIWKYTERLAIEPGNASRFWPVPTWTQQQACCPAQRDRMGVSPCRKTRPGYTSKTG